MRRVGVVVIPNTGVGAPHDEMCAAIVASDDGVENGFLRSGVAHPRRIGCQQDAVRGVIARQQLLIAAHPNRGRNVITLGFSDQRVEQQPVDDLQRHLLEVFVRSMDGVAGLEAHHRLPGALRFDLSYLHRRQVELRKSRARSGQRHHVAADGPAPGLIQNTNAGVRAVIGSIDAERLTPDVYFVSFGDVEDANRLVATEQADPVRRTIGMVKGAPPAKRPCLMTDS